MNLMMASGSYPWTIVPVERRDKYMQALKAASVKQDIFAFYGVLGIVDLTNLSLGEVDHLLTLVHTIIKQLSV
ncbi:hypothetical protein [Alteromonas mediterranea]|nr:hypothetical protein [Alteromonas mediterranea]